MNPRDLAESDQQRQDRLTRIAAVVGDSVVTAGRETGRVWRDSYCVGVMRGALEWYVKGGEVDGAWAVTALAQVDAILCTDEDYTAAVVMLALSAVPEAAVEVDAAISGGLRDAGVTPT